MKENKLFFVGQKAFIEKDGKLLVLFDAKDRVDLPGGRIQEGETDFTASLMREVVEETGLAVEVGAPFIRWSFDLHSDDPHYVGKTVFLVGYKCTYKSGDIKISEEHIRYEWVGKNDIERFRNNNGHFGAIEQYFARGVE